MDVGKIEREFVRKLVPGLEKKVAHKIALKIAGVMNEEFYPAENRFKRNFLKGALEQSRKDKKTGYKVYTQHQFKKRFLKKY